jgi:hypothetical protein
MTLHNTTSPNVTLSGQISSTKHLILHRRHDGLPLIFILKSSRN